MKTVYLGLFVVFVACGIRHGVPTAEHATAVFGDTIPVKELSELRNQVYSDYAGNSATHSMAEPPHGPLPRAVLLNLMRSHLLMPVTSDEQIIIGELSRLRHQLPSAVQYGNVTPAIIGASLVLAHLTGRLHLAPHVDYYLSHPEEAGNIYITGRLASAITTLCTATIIL